MAEKINISDIKIDCFADKTVKRFNDAAADPASKLTLGSVAASAAAEAAALAVKAIKMTGGDDPALKKAGDDIDIIRKFFVAQIDEHCKAMIPLDKRIKAGAPYKELEGGYLTAVIVVDDVLYSCIKVMELLEPVADKISKEAAYLAAAAVLQAKTAMDLVRLIHADFSAKIEEPVCAHTMRREPEMAIDGSKELFDKLLASFEGKLK